MISQTIKKLRKLHGLTQAQVAECLGLERSTYAYYEGGREPGVEILMRLCGLYKVTLEYMITGEENLGKAYLRESDAKLEHIPHLLLTDDEKKLVLLYRLCDDQEGILEYVRGLSVQT
ncbi:MAG: helix-turn-helix domain-containing protein [Clostridium sp.]|jgi:transcriptional regulator with XRE-family HTH domain|nr:helix-turn-helix domain-containing protein [Clostridium sp.]